jgi:hypothetical protein
MTDNKWARLLAFVSGLANQKLLLQNEYLAAENRILRAHLPARMRLSVPERSTLAEIVCDSAGQPSSRSPVSPSLILSSPGTAGSLPAISTAPDYVLHPDGPRMVKKSVLIENTGITSRFTTGVNLTFTRIDRRLSHKPELNVACCPRGIHFDSRSLGSRDKMLARNGTIGFGLSDGYTLRCASKVMPTSIEAPHRASAFLASIHVKGSSPWSRFGTNTSHR